jgi:hypothetical protein
MTKSILALGFMAVISIPVAAWADVITGSLNFTGTATVSLGSIAFGNALLINPAVAQTGGFVAFAGTTGTIADLVNPPDAVSDVPNLNQPDFITFAFAPNITITLTELFEGIDLPPTGDCAVTPAAAGQLCTPLTPNPSPFNLQNLSATSSSASFSLLGTEVDSISGNTIPILGTFTTPNVDQSFQQILTTIGTGGSVTTAFSANFFTLAPNVTPEPDTLVEITLGMGLLVLGVFLRKKKLAKA